MSLERGMGGGLRLVAIAVVYALAATLLAPIDSRAGWASLSWPATGFAVSALLFAGARAWPAIFAGALVAGIARDAPVPLAIALAAADTIAAFITARAIDHFV